MFIILFHSRVLHLPPLFSLPSQTRFFLLDPGTLTSQATSFGLGTMDYLWNSVSTQHLLVAVVEALQSYSITPETATSAAAKTAKSASDETSDQQPKTSTSGSANSSREAVSNSGDHHSDGQENQKAANGMSKTQIQQ